MTSRRRMLQLQAGGGSVWRSDELTPEEPLEIRVGGEPLAVTMRTPGADFHLAAGFLLTEGLIESADDIVAMRMCPAAAPTEGPLNVVDVTLRRPRPVRPRALYMTSSCGICGKSSIDQVRSTVRADVRSDDVRVAAAVISALPDALRGAQRVFHRTGGLHAAGLFDSQGEVRCVREDVGRHNAFDKVIGWAVTQRLVPLRGHVILASGRASFELAQKALLAGIPVLAAVSAPSSLAVDLAEEAGMTLVGFLRGDRMNVYAGHERIVTDGVAVMNGNNTVRS